MVQKHEASRLHYDFRLEYDGVLLSWAVPKGPSNRVKDKRLAVATENHPLEYRHFEGVIPKEEYGGGTVMIWDEGHWIPENPVKEGLEKGELHFVLKGYRMKGSYHLIRMNTKDAGDHWLLIKGKDKEEREKNTLLEYENSVISGKTMAEIQKL